MKYDFRKYQPLRLRIWHWLNALIILGLLFTVFLRKTILSWRSNMALIEEKAQAAGQQISPDLAKSIARTMTDHLWDWHYYLGFALTAVFLIRIYGFYVSRKNKEPGFLEAVRGLSQVPAESRSEAIHYTLVKTTYAGLYLLLLVMIGSGLVMYFKKSLALSENVADFILEIHETAMWLVIAFVVVHIVGVVIAENRGDRGIVSDMINGGSKK